MELSKDKIPLLIAQVEPPQNEGSGDYFYRTHSPGIAMAQDDSVRVINITNQHRYKTEIMTRADVLILKNICDPDILPLIRGRMSGSQIFFKIRTSALVMISVL